MSNEQIENNFKTHEVLANNFETGPYEKMGQIREQSKALAYLIDESCPDSREKSLAMTKLEEAMFWANASIARTA